MPNPYTVLGVPQDADQDTIRKKYKKLARRYHPDVNQEPGAEERFKEVTEAYGVLSDPEKRRMFDEFGDVSQRPGFDPNAARQWRRSGAGGFGGTGFHGGVDVDDLLSSLFEGRGRAGFGESRRGRDQAATLTIPFLLAIRGGETTIRVPRAQGSEDLTVRIPAGARDGGRLTLRGQGLPPPGGGPCGDLTITLDVEDHPLLRRDGDDLSLDVPITVLEAVKGATITVPTPTGDVRVKVPAAANSGTTLRIRGKGVQPANRPHGDLLIVLRPAVPDRLDEGLEAAAEALEQGYTRPVRDQLRL